MNRIVIFYVLMLSNLLAYGQGSFVLEQKSGKYSFRREWNEYDGKVSVDTFIVQEAGKWLIQNDGFWGIFYTTQGLLLPEAYDTIVILSDNKYGILQDNKWALYDPKGDMSGFLFDKLVSFSNGKSFVKMNGKWGYYEHETFFEEYLYLSEIDVNPRMMDKNYPETILTDF